MPAVQLISDVLMAFSDFQNNCATFFPVLALRICRRISESVSDDRSDKRGQIGPEHVR
jgi:hypothetical protein